MAEGRVERFLQLVSSDLGRDEASSSGCSDTDSTELASIL